MPTGVYERKFEHRKRMLECLELGRSKESRRKATKKMRKISRSEAWRMKVSIATRKRMRDPEVRKRHLEGIKNSKPHKMIGCNGCSITDVVKRWSNCLVPLGYVIEYAIPTKGHSTKHKPPDNYKVDFANVEEMVAVEIDGPSHNKFKQKALDTKKNEVLEALGWKVIRIKSRKGA